MFKVLGVLAAGCAVLVTAAPARADLTPDGPATVMYRYAGGHTLEGPMPQVLMAVRIVVGPGGREGSVRLRAGMRREPTVVGEPFTLPSAPGTYTFPAPRVHGDYREVRLGIDQVTGGHAITTQEACRPDPFYVNDPCQAGWLDVFAGNPPPGERGTPARMPGARLDFVPVYEPDTDGDLRGDESEDRTDLQLRIRSRKDARGRVHATLLVRNDGPRTATLPVLRVEAARARWGDTCLPVLQDGRRTPESCRLRAIRPGQSRTATLVARRDGVGAKVHVIGQGADLKAADNVRVLR